MTGYYDYVLGLIPVALLGLTGALTVAGLGLTEAVPLAAGVAACIIGHALFVNGPVSARGERSADTDATRTRSNAAARFDAD